MERDNQNGLDTRLETIRQRRARAGWSLVLVPATVVAVGLFWWLTGTDGSWLGLPAVALLVAAVAVASESRCPRCGMKFFRRRFRNWFDGQADLFRTSCVNCGLTWTEGGE
jgi:hypothetical protein